MNTIRYTTVLYKPAKIKVIGDRMKRGILGILILYMQETVWKKPLYTHGRLYETSPKGSFAGMGVTQPKHVGRCWRLSSWQWKRLNLSGITMGELSASAMVSWKLMSVYELWDLSKHSRALKAFWIWAAMLLHGSSGTFHIRMFKLQHAKAAALRLSRPANSNARHWKKAIASCSRHARRITTIRGG